tara:strand:+ start:9167 stop:10672 length:1506 start_codon:yes stop_codon:yes gene_type:complete
MCGIIGLVGLEGTRISPTLYDGLLVLQHRGQDAAGILTSTESRVFHRRANGLVRDVFQMKHIELLQGSMGLGHVRYPTAGGSSAAEAQPFYTNSPFGLSIAHNGNLTNSEELINDLHRKDHRRINTDSDSEALLNLLAAELQRVASGRKGISESLDEDTVFQAIERLHERAVGSYSLLAMITGWGLIAVRDIHGIRPLCMGSRYNDGQKEYLFASESVALDVLEFQMERDIEPGEAVIVRSNGKVSSRMCAPAAEHRPCIFEHVYFSRPDSTIDGISVHEARLEMGRVLGQRILEERPDLQIDVVVPVPDSGRIAALELATALGVQYREGFVKNRYIGRTFIMPGQSVRKDSVRKKLNTISNEFNGKNVLIVDDSIVRGNTSKRIVQMARYAGAEKVFFASCAPPVIHPNVYGIDMPARHEYIAYNRSVDEIRSEIGADWLIYQNLEDLVSACTLGGNQKMTFDCSCFDGEYVAGNIDSAYLEKLESKRKDGSKYRQQAMT